jgi:hypothetical protein
MHYLWAILQKTQERKVIREDQYGDLRSILKNTWAGTKGCENNMLMVMLDTS